MGTTTRKKRLLGQSLINKDLLGLRSTKRERKEIGKKVALFFEGKIKRKRL